MQRIIDPSIRAAAERFERETGRKISNEVPAEENEAIIEIFLIVSGYPPMRPETNSPDRRPASDERSRA